MSRISKNEYKEFRCDLCGNTEAVEVPYARNYTNGQAIHICKKCGFIYVKMRRPYDKIAQVWSKELFGKEYTSRTPLMLARHTYIAEFINQNLSLKNKKLCDIGAGEGQFLDIAKSNYGADVFGIEPSAANCKIMGKMGITHFCGTLEDFIGSLQHTGYKSDIVTIMWTLENATSCKNLIMGAYKILKNGGYLVVATGSRILVPFTKPLNLYLGDGPQDTHPSRFSFNTLRSLVSIYGFKVMHVNQYLNDGLLLCIIAKKGSIRKNVKIKGDDFRKVCNFFRRWHKETLCYMKKKS